MELQIHQLLGTKTPTLEIRHSTRELHASPRAFVEIAADSLPEFGIQLAP